MNTDLEKVSSTACILKHQYFFSSAIIFLILSCWWQFVLHSEDAISNFSPFNH